VALAASACGGSSSDSANVCTAANPAAVQQELDQGKANVQAQQGRAQQDIESSCSSS
jgi:hypothetical protein